MRTALLATPPEAFQQLIDNVNFVSKQYGLEIGARKTKVMVAGKDEENVTVTCDNEELERVGSFKYPREIMPQAGDGSRHSKVSH